MAEKKLSNPKDELAVAQGRVPIGLFPETAVIGGAMAFLEGALKYGPYNWREDGVRASTYFHAARRHLMRWWNGVDIDPGSGLRELWKVLACIAILIDAEEYDKLNDDRPPGSGRPVEEMLEYLREEVKRLEWELSASPTE